MADKVMAIMRGLPGSGKTTIAKEYEKDGYTRVNNDDISQARFGNSWAPNRSKEISQLRWRMVEDLVRQGKPLVIDNTHLGKEPLRGYLLLAAGNYYEVRIEDLRSVPVETCIERDAQRSNPVGEKVIRRMADWL